MNKFCFLLVLLFSSISNVVIGCTTFFLEKNGQMVFGRNYDWVTGTGLINTNLRGLRKFSYDPFGSKKMEWVSKFGSVTFNQYGKEFPNGGMNEKGLVIELMWLNESQYPKPDARPAISVLQWIQYQLDNCSTIEEVIASDKEIRIASTGTPQHYLIADAKGSVATIEFLNGKMVVHTSNNLPYPVLANSIYQSSPNTLKSSAGKSGEIGFQANSGDRFSKACSMVQQYQKVNINKPIVDYSFDILKSVSQGDFTKWSIVYDIKNLKIYFKSNGFEQVKNISLSAFNFACSSTPFAFNMNQSIAGDINQNFIAYNNLMNKQFLQKAFKESKQQVDINKDWQEAVARVAASTRCN